MLTFNFTRIFKSRGIDRPFSYLVKLGYSDNFATRIVNNRIKQLNLKSIEKLCEHFQCTPNDLLEWIPSSQDLNNENHPLVSIKRSNKVVELTKILNSIPLDKLNDIETMINKEIKITSHNIV
jgi:DNA-binding Xre family transcriptional regulator